MSKTFQLAPGAWEWPLSLESAERFINPKLRSKRLTGNSKVNLVTEVLPPLRENSTYLDPWWDKNQQARPHNFLTAFWAKPSLTPRACCVIR